MATLENITRRAAEKLREYQKSVAPNRYFIAEKIIKVDNCPIGWKTTVTPDNDSIKATGAIFVKGNNFCSQSTSILPEAKGRQKYKANEVRDDLRRLLPGARGKNYRTVQENRDAFKTKYKELSKAAQKEKDTKKLKLIFKKLKPDLRSDETKLTQEVQQYLAKAERCAKLEGLDGCGTDDQCDEIMPATLTHGAVCAPSESLKYAREKNLSGRELRGANQLSEWWTEYYMNHQREVREQRLENMKNLRRLTRGIAPPERRSGDLLASLSRSLSRSRIQSDQ